MSWMDQATNKQVSEWVRDTKNDFRVDLFCFQNQSKSLFLHQNGTIEKGLFNVEVTMCKSKTPWGFLVCMSDSESTESSWLLDLSTSLKLSEKNMNETN